jgi:glycosyltransferase involved in cell wall biosynthesis
MRVCIVPHTYPPSEGGVAVASHRYAKGLVEAGHSVLVVALDARVPPAQSELGSHDGVACLRVGAQRRADDTGAAWFDAIVAAHRDQPFDVVVGRYLSQAAFVAVLAARFLQLPSLVSARGNDVDRGAFDPAGFSQLLWTLERATTTTAVSQELAQKLRGLVLGAEPQVVPNGVDAELFCPGERSAELASRWGAGPVVLFTGEARQKKGLPVLLEAFARCTSVVPEATLVLVGGVRREARPMLEFFSQKYPAARLQEVSALPQAELVQYYRGASLFVMPSLHDGLPNALLEAMACGCPVVASRVGGIPDVVRDGVDGLLVPPGDVAALQQALLRVLVAPELATQLGQRARERVLSDFSLERELAAGLALLQRLVSAR